MKRFWALFKLQFNAHFGLSAMKHRYFIQHKRVWEPILIVFVLLSLIPAAVGFWGFLVNTFGTLQMLNQEQAFLTTGALFGQLAVLILGLFYLMSAFYYAQDLDRLIPLPLSPGQIVGVKFLVIVVSEWLTLVPITLPFLAVYGVYGNVGFDYWIRALVVFCLLPVIPLALAAVVTMLVVRVTNLPRNREVLRVAGGIVIVGVTLGLQFYLTRGSSDPGAIQRLLFAPQGLVQAVGSRFPPSIWMTHALAGQGLVSSASGLLLFVAASLAAGWAVMQAAEYTFLGGLQQHGSRKASSNGAEQAGVGRTAGQRNRGQAAVLTTDSFARRTPLAALFRREWLLLLRTPIWMFNVGGGLIIPLVLVPIMFLSGGLDSSMLSDLLSNSVVQNGLLVGGAGVSLFMAGSMAVAGSVLSREGRHTWISKSIPVPPRTQLVAKGLHALVMSVPVFVLVPVIVLVLTPLPPAIAGLLAVIGAAASLLIVTWGVAIDLERPGLDWEDPQRAMKSNLNPLLSLLASAVTFGIPAAVVMRVLGHSSPFLVGLVLVAWMLLVAYGVARFALERANDRYLAMN